eukprot:364257-Chlamydomonas_euryale.AAC.2
MHEGSNASTATVGAARVKVDDEQDRPHGRAQRLASMGTHLDLKVAASRRHGGLNVPQAGHVTLGPIQRVAGISTASLDAVGSGARWAGSEGRKKSRQSQQGNEQSESERQRAHNLPTSSGSICRRPASPASTAFGSGSSTSRSTYQKTSQGTPHCHQPMGRSPPIHAHTHAHRRPTGRSPPIHAHTHAPRPPTGRSMPQPTHKHPASPQAGHLPIRTYTCAPPEQQNTPEPVWQRHDIRQVDTAGAGVEDNCALDGLVEALALQHRLHDALAAKAVAGQDHVGCVVHARHHLQKAVKEKVCVSDTWVEVWLLLRSRIHRSAINAAAN